VGRQVIAVNADEKIRKLVFERLDRVAYQEHCGDCSG
jgi:hypothetical protein